MEVSEQKRNYCAPCEKRKTTTFSDGFCSQCEEEMCLTCFDTHKQWKLNQSHTRVSSVEATSIKGNATSFDTCTKHLNEIIKFVCPEHSQVGCGDCMVISHKPCKVQFILEHSDGYKDSKHFKMLKKDIVKYNSEANTMLGSIKHNKDHVKDVNKKFSRDVKLYSDKIISLIRRHTDVMLKYGDDIMAADMKNLENIETENKRLVDETTGMLDTLQSDADQPYKLFISSMSYKQNLHFVHEQLERIKENNTIKSYDFKRDYKLEQLIKTCNKLGTIHTLNKSAALREETVKANRATSVTSDQSSTKKQPFLGRQLVCKNLSIDGEFISYAEKAKGDLGLFIDKKTVYLNENFEVEIVSLGSGKGMGLGLVPDGFRTNRLPGLGLNSYGYHSNGEYVFIAILLGFSLTVDFKAIEWNMISN
ncbi:uncharacterized protein LOC132737395 [Ruditapes philippinarum]|uniref:uncharacterized protein LOC132737395 n=1 Tax=Ruditapes philippinarum TaxID=129788 RepID=UPI00295AA1D0|nr:uncharacterized protein LOC132737395 [Ruditapes philippinarum]